MFLLEGGADPKGSGNAVKAKGYRFVSDRVPVRKVNNKRCGEFREKDANIVLHEGGELEHSALF